MPIANTSGLDITPLRSDAHGALLNTSECGTVASGAALMPSGSELADARMAFGQSHLGPESKRLSYSWKNAVSGMICRSIPAVSHDALQPLNPESWKYSTLKS